jgi:hypothetical protein
VKKQNKLKEQIAAGEVSDKRKVKTGDRELDFKYHI